MGFISYPESSKTSEGRKGGKRGSCLNVGNVIETFPIRSVHVINETNHLYKMLLSEEKNALKLMIRFKKFLLQTLPNHYF